MSMTGMFYGIGVGPGDPDLLTVKAVKVMQKADVLIAPRSEKTVDSTALAIAKPHLKADVEIIDMVFPMVFEGDVLDEAWEDNRRIIGSLLEQGKNVVFLTLGDPMFFSTYIYVFHALKEAGFPIETVPGIPAFLGIASYVGFPVVEGEEVLSVVPATASEDKIDKIMETSSNLVIMKCSRNYEQLVAKLEQHGFLEHSIMVTKCGRPDEQIVRDLKSVSAAEVNYLSTILARKNKINKI